MPRRSRAFVAGPWALVALLALACACACLCLAPRLAQAHDFKPGVLALVERTPGRFEIAFSAPVDTRTAEHDIRVVYPPACRVEGAMLACGPAGLDGAIAAEGLERSAQIVLSVAWSDGRTFNAVLSSSTPRVAIDGGPSGRGGAIVSGWVPLGVLHVLTGLDHVAFVLGLMLVVGVHRRLLATVTAFTVAHSITLALAATHVVELERAPVEATIAASIVLVALEATHRRATITRVHPWAVAGLFGLVHGLGFAGALAELGLPSGSATLALLSFNVGVEVAQLVIIGAFVLVTWLAPLVLPVTTPRAELAHRAACYALGSLGVYWLLGRTVAIFGLA